VHIDVPLAKPRSGRDLDDAAGLANVDPKRQAAIEKDPGPARRCIAAGVTRHDGRLAIGPTGVLIVEPQASITPLAKSLRVTAMSLALRKARMSFQTACLPRLYDRLCSTWNCAGAGAATL
jgi:hypothetical protein